MSLLAGEQESPGTLCTKQGSPDRHSHSLALHHEGSSDVRCKKACWLRHRKLLHHQSLCKATPSTATDSPDSPASQGGRWVPSIAGTYNTPDSRSSFSHSQGSHRVWLLFCFTFFCLLSHRGYFLVEAKQPSHKLAKSLRGLITVLLCVFRFLFYLLQLRVHSLLPFTISHLSTGKAIYLPSYQLWNCAIDLLPGSTHQRGKINLRDSVDGDVCGGNAAAEVNCLSSPPASSSFFFFGKIVWRYINIL